MLLIPTYEYGIDEERLISRPRRVLTINIGKIILLLTVKRCHNREYRNLLEEMLTDINSSCVATTQKDQEDNSPKRIKN
jgi:hypothetical protein